MIITNEQRRGLHTADVLAARAEGVVRDPLLGSIATREHVGGVSVMTLHRWRKEKKFPNPDVIINKKNFWRLSSIEAWLRKQAIGGAR